MGDCKLMLQELLNSDFFNNIFGTFIGAILAFFLGLKLYKIQKDQENKATLHYFISALTALSNNLYALKEQIVQHRYKECIECKKILESSSQPRIQIQHMSKYIFGGDFEWPISDEKLEFLSTPDPNVIVLAGVLNGSIKTLNTMIIDINEDTKRYIQGEKQPDGNDIMMMIMKNEILFEQLDSALFLTNLLVDVLLKLGRIKYGKNMKIKTIELTHEKYKDIPPQPIESWQGYEWFPIKKKWWMFNNWKL